MSPSQTSVEEFLSMWRRVEAYSADPIGMILLFSLTLATGWLLQFFWPKARLRPQSRSGAWLGLVQAALYSCLAFYISYQVLIAGQIKCLGKARRCPSSFYEDEGWISIVVHPLSFWATYLYIFLVSVIFLAWFFVCARSINFRSAR